jgi:hypothetical protein
MRLALENVGEKVGYFRDRGEERLDRKPARVRTGSNLSMSFFASVTL